VIYKSDEGFTLKQYYGKLSKMWWNYAGLLWIIVYSWALYIAYTYNFFDVKHNCYGNIWNTIIIHLSQITNNEITVMYDTIYYDVYTYKVIITITINIIKKFRYL